MNNLFQSNPFQKNPFRSKSAKALNISAPGILVLHLPADATPGASEGFERAIGKTLAAGPRLVIVDFSEADFVSTVMLGLLLKLRREAAEMGVEVRLAQVQPMVRRVLNICRLDQLFSVCSSVEAAMDGTACAVGV